MVILAAAVLHYFLYSQYLHRMYENDKQKTLISTSNSISRSVKFYQSVVDKMATQHVVIDLLQFGNPVETQVWANEMQKLLPDSIGIMLFDINAQALGLPGEMRLNKNCLADTQKRYNEGLVTEPPVHTNIEEFAHFDLISPVFIDGERIGLVFASFSLDVIRRILTDIEINNQKIRVVDSDGTLIAVSGSIDEGADQVQVFGKVIAGTDWRLEFTVVDTGKNVLVTSLLFSNVITFIFLSLILYVAISRLFRAVVADFEILSWMMQSIKEGSYKPADSRKVTLKESKNIIRFIKHTAEELYRYQQKLKSDSTTDELTGLHNRRSLNDELDKCMELANKGNDIHIVILDLDKFKLINDTHGHDVGDVALKLMSESLLENSSEDDVCARAGGDEFIVIMTGYTEDSLNVWYKKIRESMQLKISKYSAENNIDLEFGVSAGCTFIRNRDRKSTVLKRADNALYKVKEEGGNKLRCV